MKNQLHNPVMPHAQNQILFAPSHLGFWHKSNSD